MHDDLYYIFLRNSKKVIYLKRKKEALKSPKGLPPSLNKDIFHRNGGGRAVSNFIDDWDISRFPGSEMLSDTERRLCSEIRLPPSHYPKMLQNIIN